MRQRRLAIAKYRTDQQVLMQLRSIILVEALAARGIPIANLMQVSTEEKDKKPEKVDWDCAMNTEDDSKVSNRLLKRLWDLHASSFAARNASSPSKRKLTKRLLHRLAQPQTQTNG